MVSSGSPSRHVAPPTRAQKTQQMSRIVPSSPRWPDARSTARRARRLLLILASLLGVLVTPSTSLAETVPYPPTDPWYAAPADLASMTPRPDHPLARRDAALVRAGQAAVQGVPGALQDDRPHGAAIPVTATIVIPLKRPATERRLISYQTAYDGLSPACQPSYSLRTGKVGLQSAETILMTNILSRGWTIVTTDYEGPDNNWASARRPRTACSTASAPLRRSRPRASPTRADEGRHGRVLRRRATPRHGQTSGRRATRPSSTSSARRTAAPARSSRASSRRSTVSCSPASPSRHHRRHLRLPGDRHHPVPQQARQAGLQGAEEPVLLVHHGLRVQVRLPALPRSAQRKDRDLLTRPQFLAIGEENSLGRFAPKAPVFWYQTYWDQMNGYWLARAMSPRATASRARASGSTRSTTRSTRWRPSRCRSAPTTGSRGSSRAARRQRTALRSTDRSRMGHAGADAGSAPRTDGRSRSSGAGGRCRSPAEAGAARPMVPAHDRRGTIDPRRLV